MTAMIERVAQAVFIAMDPSGAAQSLEGNGMVIVPPHLYEKATVVAIAAITAMRDPTPYMLKACDKIMGSGFTNAHSDQETWEVMIDAALTEKPTPLKPHVPYVPSLFELVTRTKP